MEDVGSNPAPHHRLASGHLLPTSQVGTRTGQSNEMLVRIQEPQLSDEELNPRETGAPCRSKSCEQGRLLPWASGGLPWRELGPPSHPGARTSCEAGMTTGRECGRGRACHDRTPLLCPGPKESRPSGLQPPPFLSPRATSGAGRRKGPRSLHRSHQRPGSTSGTNRRQQPAAFYSSRPLSPHLQIQGLDLTDI